MSLRGLHQGLIAKNFVDTGAEALPSRRMTIREELLAQKDYLTDKLAHIDKALALLEENPKVNELLDVLQTL